LWLVSVIANDANGQFVTDWPTEVGGWTQPVELAASGAQSVITAAMERLLTAASFDPGTLLLNAARDWIGYTISVPVTVTAGDYPVVEGVAESPWASASTSQAMNLPAGIAAGDLLLAEIATTGDPTIAITDWTTLLGPSGPDVNERGAVLYKVADGTESGTVTVTLGSSQSGAAVCRRISGADATKLDGAINPAAASTTITPPALTPADGSDAILWLIGYTFDSTSGIPVSPWPFNYATAGAFVSKDSGLISGLSALTVASVTPPSFTLSASRRTVSWTVAVYPAATVPAAPSNPAAVAVSASQIDVSWDDVADETGYRVERSPNGSSGWVDVSGNLPAGTTSYQDTGLTASTQYFYRVIAFNAVGDSTPSTVVNATTQAGPTPPSGASVLPSSLTRRLVRRRNGNSR
jgi:hypothetical protein